MTGARNDSNDATNVEAILDSKRSTAHHVTDADATSLAAHQRHIAEAEWEQRLQATNQEVGLQGLFLALDDQDSDVLSQALRSLKPAAERSGLTATVLPAPLGHFPGVPTFLRCPAHLASLHVGKSAGRRGRPRRR